jgi:hypothetical protein
LLRYSNKTSSGEEKQALEEHSSIPRVRFPRGTDKRTKDSNQKQHSGIEDVLVQIFILKFSMWIVSLTELDEIVHLLVNSLEFCRRDRK